MQRAWKVAESARQRELGRATSISLVTGVGIGRQGPERLRGFGIHQWRHGSTSSGPWSLLGRRRYSSVIKSSRNLLRYVSIVIARRNPPVASALEPFMTSWMESTVAIASFKASDFSADSLAS
jgi:hypothetical protein